MSPKLVAGRRANHQPCGSASSYPNLRPPIPPMNLMTGMLFQTSGGTWLSTFDAPRSYWMNSLSSASRAENEVTQLRTASECGFSIPATLVTNSRASAESFSKQVGSFVIRFLSAGYCGHSSQAFMFTQSRLPQAAGLGQRPQVTDCAV